MHNILETYILSRDSVDRDYYFTSEEDEMNDLPDDTSAMEEFGNDISGK